MRLPRSRAHSFMAAVLAAGMLPACAAPVADRTRLIVTTDISTLTADQGEPDDTQSLVRLLLYANDFDIEGLIATEGGRGNAAHTEFLRAAIAEYGKVRDNLARHDPRYPTAEFLLERIKAGFAEPASPGKAAVRRREARVAPGPDRDSEGSRWIIERVDKPDPRPVWVTAWGGEMDLAQALWRVSNERTPEEAAKFKAQLRVFAINDQDDGGPWIRKNHPDVFYILSHLVQRGMYRDGDATLVTREWVDAHVRTGHGPLGAAYPNYQGGDPWGKVLGVKEGDTPSFLYLLPNGLGNPEQPTWGSWGGRFTGPGPQFFDAKDTVAGQTSERATVHRWRAAYQADFQARLDWCVKPVAEANHAPVAVLDGPAERTVAAGERIALSAAGSRDPDGNGVSYQWTFYPEPGTYRGPLTIENSDAPQAAFVAPRVDAPQTLHIILTVTDRGAPPLSRYRRVVVTVKPG